MWFAKLFTGAASVVFPWWARWLAIAALAAGLAGFSYLKGRAHEQLEQKAELSDWYAQEILRGKALARAHEADAAKAAKEREAARALASARQRSIEELLRMPNPNLTSEACSLPPEAFDALNARRPK